MKELTAEVAQDFLFDRNLIPEDSRPTVEALSWGISNVVLRVELPDDCFVMKQPLAKLRVEDDWPFDQTRISVERNCMALLGKLLAPGSVPDVRFYDEAEMVLGMSCAPPEAFLWKEALLDGRVEFAVARLAGELLARIHSATAVDPHVREQFGDRTVFIQGRVDPYHWTTAEAHADLAHIIHAEVERMLASPRTLVHGDYSPKNVFVCPGHLLILDFEVAHYGDPSFDVAFCMNHLFLKAINFPQRHSRYLEAARIFWTAYTGGLPDNLRTNLELPTIRELGCLMLARIDGKSKIEYITDEPTRDVARSLARAILTDSSPSISSALALANQRLEAFAKGQQ